MCELSVACIRFYLDLVIPIKEEGKNLGQLTRSSANSKLVDALNLR
jgi:hypothetical protein